VKARFVLAALLALFAILTLVDRFVLVEMLVVRTGIPLLVAAAMAAACAGAGRMARGGTRDLPLDFLIGYPLIGTACFLVGLVKVNVWTMGAVVLLAAALNVRRWRAGTLAADASGGLKPGAPLPRDRFGLAAVVAVLACGFVAAQAPPSSLDELAYHLAVPNAWVLEGRATELPLLSHSYFPLGIESADLGALALLGATGGGIASHFLHLLAAIATAGLIARRTQSWLATAAIVTTPALAVTAGWSLVDWPLAGLFVATWILLEDGDVRGASAATAAGLLTKYTFLPFAVLLWAVKRKRPHWIVGAGLVFFVRNLLLTGNPFAPFFGAGAPHVSGFRTLALADYVFDPKFIDEALGASIFTLPAFATGAIALGSVAIAVALFFLTPSARILVPYLVVPSMTGAPALKKGWLAVVVGIAVVMQTFFVIAFTARGGAFSLLNGDASEDEFLRQQRASHASVVWLNETLPAEARVLVVGTGETFWFTRRVRGGGNFDGPRVSSYFAVPAPEALRARLKEDGITHVVVIAAPLPTKSARKVEERQMTLSPAAQRMLALTLNAYAANVTSRGDATLFTLR
jgi:hypothetical protein